MRPIRFHPLIMAFASIAALAVVVGGIFQLTPNTPTALSIKPGMTPREIENVMGAPAEVLRASDTPQVRMYHGEPALCGYPIDNVNFIYTYHWGIDQSCYVFFDQEDRAFLINSGGT